MGILIVFNYGIDEPEPDHLIPLIWKIPYSKEECGGIGFKSDALEGLNFIRKKVKKRYYVFSGFRDEERNKKAGGVSNQSTLKRNCNRLMGPN